MKHAADVLRAALPALEKTDVTIALEPLAPAETNFINTAADGVELMELVGSPRCRLHLDCKAMAKPKPTPIPELIHKYREAVRPFPRQRSEPPRAGLRQARFRADHEGACARSTIAAGSRSRFSTTRPARTAGPRKHQVSAEVRRGKLKHVPVDDVLEQLLPAAVVGRDVALGEHVLFQRLEACAGRPRSRPRCRHPTKL